MRTIFLVLICSLMVLGAYTTSAPDLDGDGQTDIISFVLHQSENDYPYNYTLTVNNIAVSGWGDNMDEGYQLVDIDQNDAITEIAISEEGPSADNATTYFFYNGKQVLNMGKIIASYPNEIMLVGNGTIIASTRAKVLQTWCYYGTYALNDQHQLVRVPQQLYPTYCRVMVKQPLTLQKSPTNSEASVTLQPGEYISLIGTDDEKWILVQNSLNQTGWFAVENHSELAGTHIQATEYFEGLNYCD